MYKQALNEMASKLEAEAFASEGEKASELSQAARHMRKAIKRLERAEVATLMPTTAEIMLAGFWS